MKHTHSKRRSGRIFLLGLLAALTLALCGCSPQDVSFPSGMDMVPGQSYPLLSAVKIQGEEPSAEMVAETLLTLQQAETGVSVDFASSAPRIVSVDENGVLTALKTGTADITVRCAALDASYEIAVTVAGVPTTVAIDDSMTLAVGDAQPLDIVVDAENVAVNYTVENEKIATVDPAGLVTGVATGETAVTASVPGTSLTAACTVYVGDAVQSIALTRAAAELPIGGRMVLGAGVQSTGTDTPAITWASSDETVAAVDAAGTVTAFAAGETSITATAGGKTAACTLSVTNPATPEDAVPAAIPAEETPETAVTASPLNEAENTPETATPENATAETATAETAAAETATAETATAETATAETATAETATAETATAETATAETATAETATTETATAETATAETATAETATAETATAETAIVGTATPETTPAPTQHPETLHVGQTAPVRTGENAESMTPETAVTFETATPESTAKPAAEPVGENPATAESAGSTTPETATPETATAETATPETATPESSKPNELAQIFNRLGKDVRSALEQMFSWDGEEADATDSAEEPAQSSAAGVSEPPKTDNAPASSVSSEEKAALPEK